MTKPYKARNKKSWEQYCDSSYGKRRYIIKAVANGAGAIKPEIIERAHPSEVNKS